MKKPLAILLSDLHLSQNAPVARSAEPNWFDVIRRQWRPVNKTARKYNIPLVIAGDIFDRWNASPEVINLAIELFDAHTIYAVPGQHDLPNHCLDQIHRSAYGVLADANIIENVQPSPLYPSCTRIDNLSKYKIYMHGFPWGHEPHPINPTKFADDPNLRSENPIHIAVVHKYIWTQGTGYTGAPEETKLTDNTVNKFAGYDAVVVGDNHQHFHHKHIFNSGSFIPRHSNEQYSHTPCYGILWSDRRITKHLLPTEEDKWISTFDIKEISEVKHTEFVRMLENLGGEQLEFTSTLKLYLDKQKVTGRVKEIVMEVLEEDGTTK